jgi:hypothetical protein
MNDKLTKRDALNQLHDMLEGYIDMIHEEHADCIPDAWKASLQRRDKREPGRRDKQLLTDKIYSAIRKHMGRVRDRLKEFVGIKSDMWDAIRNVLDWQDDDFIREVIRLLQVAGVGGISLFKDKIGVGFDFTLVNAEVAKWASTHAIQLAADISKTTLDALQKSVETFISTPGYSMGDIVNDLINSKLSPLYGDNVEQRAWNIATTEVTRAYAQGQQQGADALSEQYPDVKVIKRWFTNYDDRVCDLCFPLDGAEVPEDENFYEPESDYEDGNPPRHVNCRCWMDYTTKITDD